MGNHEGKVFLSRRRFRLLLSITLVVGIGCSGGGGTGEGGDGSSGGSSSLPPRVTDLAFSTYLGGMNQDSIRDVTTDAQGNVYVTGGTESSNFPTTPGAYDRTFNGWHDVYVAKFSPRGNLMWSTFIGGPNYDRAYAIEVDSTGVYVAGRAGSGYPTTPGVLQPGFGGDVKPNNLYGAQDGFITKLTLDGSRVIWSTYFGGADPSLIRDMDIDGTGNVYLAMPTVSLPNPHITSGAFQKSLQGGYDGVVAKVSGNGTRVIYATYLGGLGDDGGGAAIRVDGLGHAYVAAGTRSGNMPVTAGAYQRLNRGGQDLFLAKFSPDGSSLLYGTYFGGSDLESTETHSLWVDASGNAYISMTTYSSDIPVSSGAYQRTFGGSYDAFVAKISSDGTRLIGGTYLGGGGGEGTEGIEVDASGNVYVGGTTLSANFPVTPNAFQGRYGGGGVGDTYAVKLSPNLSQMLYGTYMGGGGADQGRALTVDSSGNFYIGGMTQSNNWTIKNAFQTSRGGDWDAELVQLIP